jgi:hypothetical protein
MKEALAEAYQAHSAFHKASAQKHEQLEREHASMEKSHMALSKCFAKADGMEEVAQHHKALAESHGRTSENHGSLKKFHGDAGDACSGFASDCQKANAADLAKIVPDGITSVIPRNVPQEGFGIRAVPRAGAPTPGEFSKAQIDAIDPRFHHLIGVDEE